MTGPRSIAQVEDLIAYIELTGLRWFEISGRRRDEDAPAPSVDSDEALISVQAQESHDETSIQARFRTVVEQYGGDYVMDIGMRYEFSEPLDLHQEAIAGFLSRVAMFAAWPFIREGVASAASRMELPVPVLGLLRQGMVDFQPGLLEDADEAEA